MESDVWAFTRQVNRKSVHKEKWRWLQFQESLPSHGRKELLYYYGKKFFKIDPSILQQELEQRLRGGPTGEGMSLETAIYVE